MNSNVFTTKKTNLNLKKTANKSMSSDSPFIKAAMKSSAETLSGNGALKYSTSGDPFVDQFNMLGVYRTPRPFGKIAADCEVLWAHNKVDCIKFMYFIRTISRVCNDYVYNTKTTVAQKGGELKHEGIMRLIWLQLKNRQLFEKINGLSYLVVLGSFHDVFTMLQYDLIYNGWDNRALDWNYFKKFILSSLANENTCELVKKYLPKIKADSACKTVEAQANNIIAKWICSCIFGPRDYYENNSFKAYRKLKSSGTAHQWQQLISKQKYNDIDFEKIHGRALTLLAKSKFLDNHNLREKFTEWITSNKTTNVKSTEYVHELFSPLCQRNATITIDMKTLINKKFNTIVNKVKDSENYSKLIVVRDISSSMDSKANGTNMSSYNVAKAMALYFSEFLTGKFANAYMEFADNVETKKWIGDTPVDKWINDNSCAYGSTNFMGVIREFVKIKKSGVDESDFPSGILCISDGEFDPADLGKTNVETARRLLREGGFSDDYINNFVIILWNIPNSYYSDPKPKFETYGDVKNVFYMSGYSASIISFFTDRIKTPKELFENAMDQEVLNSIESKIKCFYKIEK